MNVIEGQKGQDLFPEERLRDLGLFSLEKRRAGRILPIYLNTRRDCASRTEPGSFQWQDMRQWTKPETWEDLYKHQKILFYCESDQILVQCTPPLPWEVKGSPFMEIFQSHLDTVLGNWLWMALLELGDGTRPSPKASFNLNPFEDPKIIKACLKIWYKLILIGNSVSRNSLTHWMTVSESALPKEALHIYSWNLPELFDTHISNKEISLDHE